MDKKISYSRDKVGERLKEVRIHLNRTQKEFAALLNISQNALSNYEKGRRYPSYRILVEISQIANVSPAWLLIGEGSGDGITRKKKELLNYLEKLGITDAKEAKEIFTALKLEALIYQITSVRLSIEKIINLQKNLTNNPFYDK
ncbi:MAG: helix-turn-helix transcriptional regulator [bacterium]|nr:helix-turn-helix transcriptional regulator [bacterium]